MTRYAIAMAGAVFGLLAGTMTTPAAAQKCATATGTKGCVQYRCVRHGLCGGPIVFTRNGCTKMICEKVRLPPKFPPRRT